MKKIILIVITALIAIFYCNQCFAQPISVSGTIKGSDGQPIIGATVVALNASKSQTGKGTKTDIDGKYTIKVPQYGYLRFSYIEYKTVTVTVNN